MASIFSTYFKAGWNVHIMGQEAVYGVFSFFSGVTTDGFHTYDKVAS